MDLPTVTEVVSARHRADLAGWRPGDAYLAGGSWLYSEPQPLVQRLVDLTTLGWPPLEVSAAGLRIAATCTFAELAAADLPARWPAAALVRPCCEALLGSFKVWNVATVGGNLCLALPAGPMTSLTAALDGVCTVWSPDGSQRQLPVTDLVVGAGRTSLLPGEVLRSVLLPEAALSARTTFRRHSLSNLGRSAVLVVGRLGDDAVFDNAVFTVTAATTRPVQLRFGSLPSTTRLLQALDDAGLDFYDDVHGLPQWRAALTRQSLAEVRDELAGR